VRRHFWGWVWAWWCRSALGFTWANLTAKSRLGSARQWQSGTKRNGKITARLGS
jgi:hypothetical protein